MRRRRARRLHAAAWWLWALGLVAAATQTRNPLLLGLIIAVASLVVASRRTQIRWAGGYRMYLVVGLVVVAIRVGFRLLLGGDFGRTPLVDLPRVSLPAGVELGGTVTVEELLAGLYDGLRLATIVVVIGAANSLADPRRLLPSLPRSLAGVATSAVVALSLAPQLVESLARVRRARRLRGESGRGLRSVRSLLVPVLEDALHRSIALAASMDSRGYGRSGAGRAQHSVIVGLAAWLGLGAVCVGLFGLLSGGDVVVSGGTMTAGAALAALGLTRLGRNVARTRYRPDAWGGREWLVTLAGGAAAVGLAAAGVMQPTTLNPSLQPLEWPGAGPVALLSLLLAALPAISAPQVAARAPRPIVEKAA